jgi:cellulose synthase/poly-beta-1,6-N-acetylglucosamine synthase-like glycosyltransferase
MPYQADNTIMPSLSGFPAIAFVALLILAVYLIAGYPLLLAWRARTGGKPVLKRADPQCVSIILAVRNGEKFLAAKLDSILNSDYPRDLMDIIVASNGSTDSTAAIAASYAGRGVRLIELAQASKPDALNEAVRAASAPILVFTDVRQALDPQSIARLVACFADATVGVTSGYLVVRSAGIEEDNVGLYWRYERWIRSNLSRLDSTLGATGALYAIRRELFRPVPSDTLLDDMFIPLAAFFRGYRLILEDQARLYDDPTSINVEFRRKVRTLAGNYQIMHLYPDLFTARNRLRFDFLSYKFGRLLLPWIFLGILVLSFFISQPWSGAAIAVQALFYGLAALDVGVGPRSPLKRLTSAPRTVVTMLAASACAIVIFFVPANRLWVPTHTATAK